ncbi:MAG: N-(5'-phosphoribosyl)anthranilate isomerase [Pyrinomonadaceae bacterium]
MVRVKICGIMSFEDAMHAWDCGADEIGFNFYKGSKRYVLPEIALEIIGKASRSGNVGVFVNEPVESLLEIAEFVGLDLIQLHGDEDKEYLKRLRDNTEMSIIKAFRVGPGFSVGDAVGWDFNFRLFDTQSAGSYGGTGQTFDWGRFRSENQAVFPLDTYLAGGLTPENVAEAIRTLRPYAVDVASGVESSTGKKDPKKVEAFIKNAKNA